MFIRLRRPLRAGSGGREHGQRRGRCHERRRRDRVRRNLPLGAGGRPFPTFDRPAAPRGGPRRGGRAGAGPAGTFRSPMAEESLNADEIRPESGPPGTAASRYARDTPWRRFPPLPGGQYRGRLPGLPAHSDRHRPRRAGPLPVSRHRQPGRTDPIDPGARNPRPRRRDAHDRRRIRSLGRRGPIPWRPTSWACRSTTGAGRSGSPSRSPCWWGSWSGSRTASSRRGSWSRRSSPPSA